MFDFAAGVGGQEEVSLIIRNNLPVISPSISDKSVSKGKSFTLDLSDFENDVEDSGSALAWEIISFGSNVSVSLIGKILTINGLVLGSSDVVLRLVDLDLDFDDVSFSVDVQKAKSSSSGGGSSGCRNEWECSLWSDCVDGVMVRDCIDRRNCNTEKNRPIELESCSVFDFIKEGDNSSVISLNSSFSGVEIISDSYFVWEDYIVWIVLVLVILILVILILIMLVI